jgi:hypothetical protein
VKAILDMIRTSQKALGVIVTVGGCAVSATTAIIGALVITIGVIAPFKPMIIAGIVIITIAAACFGLARLLADAVDGPNKGAK